MSVNPDHVRLIREGLAPLRSARGRVIIGIAGAPASGKSTLAEALVDALNSDANGTAALVPMDGFHLDNRILDSLGLRSRKGAPETFDVHGFLALLARLREGREEVFAPVFDRDRDLAIAGAQAVPTTCPVIVVEGNYLLLDEEPWRQVRRAFDLSVRLDVPLAELERRLVERWRHHGLAPDAAARWIATNDLPNAERVVNGSGSADLVLGGHC